MINILVDASSFVTRRLDRRVYLNHRADFLDSPVKPSNDDSRTVLSVGV